MDAVHTGVGELILRSGGAVELDVAITRNASEEDFVGDRVYRGEHVDVTKSAGAKLTVGVIAADINRKGFGGNIDFRFINGIGFDFDLDCVENLGILAKISGILVDDGFMDGAEENRVKFAGEQLIGHGMDGTNGLKINCNSIVELLDGFLINFNTFIVGADGFSFEVFDIAKRRIVFYDDVVLLRNVSLRFEIIEKAGSFGDVTATNEINTTQDNGYDINWSFDDGSRLLVPKEKTATAGDN